MGVAGGEPRRAARFAGCPFMERVLARHGGTLPRGLFPRGEASVAELARAVHGEGGVVALGGAAGRMSGAASRPLASLSMGASLGPGAGGGDGDGGGGMDDFKRNELRELLDGGGARKKPAQRGPAPRAGGGKHSVRVAATSSSSPVSRARRACAHRAPHLPPPGPVSRGQMRMRSDTHSPTLNGAWPPAVARTRPIGAASTPAAARRSARASVRVHVRARGWPARLLT